MGTIKVKKGEIKMRPDYVATIMSIPVGEKRCYKIEGTVCSSVSSAASRMKSLNLATFETVTDVDANLLLVERTS